MSWSNPLLIGSSDSGFIREHPHRDILEIADIRRKREADRERKRRGTRKGNVCMVDLTPQMSLLLFVVSFRSLR